jgi:hypothetical protein
MLRPLSHRYLGVLLFLALTGCDENRPVPSELPQDVTPLGGTFDPRDTGTIRGDVIWQGALPVVAPFEYRPKVQSPSAERQAFPNPNTPVIDGPSRGVGNAVVFLRAVNPLRSKPWNHAGVFVDVADKRMRLEQGHELVHSAFARHGELLSMVSSDDRLHIVRARGAAFFSLTFTVAHKSRQRRLDQKGLIEMSSGVGHFWQRGYVFVDDHPYYTRTDAQGRFALSQVPTGDYQLVCWIPNWKVREQERDPETAVVRFVTFAPALELEQAVNVLPQSEPTLQFRVEERMFHP